MIVAVGKSAEQQADEYSLNIGAATLKAVAPAWLSAGRNLHELVQAALSIALPLSAPQAVLLLSALISALPQVESPGLAWISRRVFNSLHLHLAIGTLFAVLLFSQYLRVQMDLLR